MQAQDSAEPIPTARNTKWAVNLWKEWSECRKNSKVESPDRPPHLLTFEQLNYWMCKFVLEIRRKNDKEYPPNTLYSDFLWCYETCTQYCPDMNFERLKASGLASCSIQPQLMFCFLLWYSIKMDSSFSTSFNIPCCAIMVTTRTNHDSHTTLGGR